MLKVDYCKPKFIQNENCVICLLKVELDTGTYIDMDSAIGKWVKNHPSLKVGFEPFVSEVTSRGIARCSDSDTFNLDFGKKLAESRARRRLYGFLSTLAWKITIEKLNQGKSYTKSYEKYNHCIDTESQHIEFLLKNS